MKRILMAAAVVLAAAGQALAADLPPPMAPPPRAPATYVPVVAPWTWSGIYIGLNGGYDFGSSKWNAATGGTSGSFSTSGFLFGPTLGGNVQMGSFVFGLEGDFDWANLTGTFNNGCAAGCKTQENWLGTARARAGWAFDRILLYGTGGGAFGNIKSVTPPGSNNSTEFGWTAGGGLEFAFTPNWTAKAEYLFVSLSNGSCTTACMAQFKGSTASVSLTENIVRVGVNYKFGY